MEIGKKFNRLTLKEYFFYIDNYKKCEDFNTLGLYRSLIENENISPEEKIQVREYAHKIFKKTFDFLQLKDPKTFIEVSTLGLKLTQGDERQLWENVRKNQQKILADKKIKHRNFGDYSKHNCGDENCVWNGIMIRQGSSLSYGHMHFESDKNRNTAKNKSHKRKSNRKKGNQIIQRELEHHQSISGRTKPVDK